MNVRRRVLLSGIGSLALINRAESSFPPHGGPIGGSHPPNWYNPAWGYRKQITIPHANVTSGDSYTNFPVLISETSDSNLVAHALSTGNDILFTASDGTTKLNHEIESYTGGTGAIIAWVQVPGLSSSADNIFFMYYGNPASGNQQNVAATWNSHYKGVYHLAASNNYLTTVRYPGNPILTYGGTGWKARQIQEPIVLPDPAAPTTGLIMFFAGMDSSGNQSIGRATASVSAPFTWTEYSGNPIINDTNRRLDSVLYIGGVFWLYSTNHEGTGGIDLFQSTDGFTFTKNAASPVLTPTGNGRNDGDYVSQGAVWFDAGSGDWTMIYAWRNTSLGETLQGYKYATSPDGITWTKGGTGTGIIIPIGATGTPDSTYMEFHFLVKIGSTYVLVYECYNGTIYWICTASSTSLTSGWVKSGTNPSFQPSGVSGAFDQYHVATPTFAEIGGTWYLFYQGANLFSPYTSANWALGQATLTGTSGETLTPLDFVTGGVIDSTANDNNLIGCDLTPTTGEIDGAFTFDGVSAHASSLMPASTATTNYTLQAWLRPASLSQASIAVQNGYNGPSTGTGVGFGMGDGSGNVGSELVGLASSVAWMPSGYSFTSTTTKISVSMVNNAGTTTLYVDGSATGTTSTATALTPTQGFGIGSAAVGMLNWAGDIDEVRFSDTVRSVSWITTEYTNQSAPSSFYSFGAETPY